MSSSYQDYGQTSAQDYSAYSAGLQQTGTYSDMATYNSSQMQYSSVEQYSSGTTGADIYSYNQYATPSTTTTTTGTDNNTAYQYDQSYGSAANSYSVGSYEQYSSNAGGYNTTYTQPYVAGTSSESIPVQTSTGSYSVGQYAPTTQYGSGDSSQYGVSQYTSGGDQYGSSDQYGSTSQYVAGNSSAADTSDQYRGYGSADQYGGSGGDSYAGNDQYSHYASSSTTAGMYSQPQAAQPLNTSSYADYSNPPATHTSYNYAGVETTGSSWQGDNSQYGGGSWNPPKSPPPPPQIPVQSTYNQDLSKGSYDQSSSFQSSSTSRPALEYPGSSVYKSQVKESYDSGSQSRSFIDSSSKPSSGSWGSYSSSNQNRGSSFNSSSNDRSRNSFNNNSDLSRGSFNIGDQSRSSYGEGDQGRGFFSGHDRGRGSFSNTDRGRGSFSNNDRGRGSFNNNDRGRGSFNNNDRGRGSFNSSSDVSRGSYGSSDQSRGSFSTRGRDAFDGNRGRGSFDKTNRGRGSYDNIGGGRGSYRNNSPSSTRGRGGRGGFAPNNRGDEGRFKFDSHNQNNNQGGSSYRGGFSGGSDNSKNWSRPQESLNPRQLESKAGVGWRGGVNSPSQGPSKPYSGDRSSGSNAAKGFGGSPAGVKTPVATPFIKPNTPSSASALTKPASKTPVFGSGDREPFSRGTRGKSFTPASKPGTKPPASKPGDTPTTPTSAKPSTTSSPTSKPGDKPKSAIEKQAEIALKCAAAFKGVSTPVPESDVKSGAKSDQKASTLPSSSGTKSTTSAAAVTNKDVETKMPAVEMTEEERAREEEIQRKIKESVVVITNNSNPTAEEVEKILKAPPAFEVPKHLQEKLEKLTTPTYCQLCSLVLNAPLQAAQHYQGKNHAKRVRIFITSDGNVSVGKAAGLAEAAATTTTTTTTSVAKPLLPGVEGGEEKKEGEAVPPPLPTFDESKKWECCTLCGVGFTSLKQAEQHYGGKNHAKKVRLSEANACLEKAVEANLVKRDYIPVVSGPTDHQVAGPHVLVFQRGGCNVFECSLCSVMVTSEDQLNTHLRGIKHQNKLKQANGENMPRGRGRGGFRGGRGGPRGGFSQGPPREERAEFGGARGGMMARGRGRGRGFQRGGGDSGSGRGGKFWQGGDRPMLFEGAEFRGPDFPPMFDDGFGFPPRPGFKRRERSGFDDFGPPRGKRPRRGF